jgi:hypothetical protein
VVRSLPHPIIRDGREFHGVAVELERREIADLNEAAGIFLGEGGEGFAFNELAGLGESLCCEGRIHFVEHSIMNDRGNFAIGRKGDLAAHRHPYVRMGERGVRTQTKEKYTQEPRDLGDNEPKIPRLNPLAHQSGRLPCVIGS